MDSSYKWREVGAQVIHSAKGEIKPTGLDTIMVGEIAPLCMLIISRGAIAIYYLFVPAP